MKRGIFLRFLKQVLRFTAVFFSLMLLFLLLLVGVYLIPTKPMQAHMAAEMPLLLDEGVYPRPFFGDAQTQGDNFTEALILSMAVVPSEGGVLTRAVTNAVSFSGDNPIESLGATVDPDAFPDTTLYHYGLPKYWNGALVLLKPLLYLFGYKAVRAVCFQAMFAAFALVLLRLRKQLGSLYALGFGLCLVAVRFFVVPGTVTMALPWVVALLACYALLVKRTFRTADCLLLFFVVGCVTNYFDYMLTVLFSLGLPLVVLASLLQRQRPDQNLLQRGGVVAGCSAAYFIGFGLSWCFKWVVSALLIEGDVWQEVFTSIFARSDVLEGARRTDAMRINYAVLTTPVFKTAAVILLVLLVAVVVLFPLKNKRVWQNAIPLAFVALYPCIWYVFASSHSQIHAAFVFRYTVITLLAVVFGLLSLVDQSALHCFLQTKCGLFGGVKKATLYRKR